MCYICSTNKQKNKVMKTAEIEIIKDKATLYFNGLLEREDFDMFWKGMDPDNNDGSAGSFSETVKKIESIYSSLVNDEYDFQVWGPDSSFAKNIPLENVKDLIEELNKAFLVEIEFTGERIDKLLKEWIVVKELHPSDEEEYHITLRKNFEKINMCETYDAYGQKVDCYNAGCYSLENPESSARNDFLEDLYKHFNIDFDDDQIDDDYYHRTVNNENDLLENIPSEKISQFMKNWQEKNETHTECVAWVYHDGSNFQSIVTETIPDDIPKDMEEANEVEAVPILLEYPGQFHIEGAEAIEETENFLFRETKWASDPWMAHVMEK